MTGKKSCTVHIAHRVSHRTRFKVGKQHRTPQNLGRIKKALEDANGVHHVHINEKTGSVIVHHGADTEVSEHCHEIIKELMCECVEVAMEAVSPELGPFAALFTKLLPLGDSAAVNQLAMPISLVAVGFIGVFHLRAFLVPIAELLPFV